MLNHCCRAQQLLAVAETPMLTETHPKALLLLEAEPCCQTVIGVNNLLPSIPSSTTHLIPLYFTNLTNCTKYCLKNTFVPLECPRNTIPNATARAKGWLFLFFFSSEIQISTTVQWKQLQSSCCWGTAFYQNRMLTITHLSSREHLNITFIFILAELLRNSIVNN